MLQPSYLKSGDKVLILSSARKISLQELRPSISLLESWGLEVELGENIFKVDNQFAGTEKERIKDLQSAIDNLEIKAIFFARGGYGSVQIVDRIDWENFLNYPKWLIGFSDVTVFHSHINKQFNIETLHSWMPINLVDNKTSELAIDSLKELLFYGQVNYEWKVNELNSPIDTAIQGELVGGNLSIIYSLSGSKSQLNLKGKILFIEDLDEYLYHIDRMMMNLKRSDLFDGCKAIIVGGMSDMNDNSISFGKTALEIIKERISEIGIPIFFDFPAGHIIDNRPIVLGRKVILSKKGNKLNLSINGRA